MSILQYCNLSVVWESSLIYPPDCIFLEWHGCLKDNIQMNLKEVEQASSAKNIIQHLPGHSEVSIENYIDKSQGISTSAELLVASPSVWCWCEFCRMSLHARFRKFGYVYCVKDVSVLLMKPKMCAHSLNREMNGQ